MPTTSDYEPILRGPGLRDTRPRLPVLSVVHGQPHADTDRIITAGLKALGPVSHQGRGHFRGRCPECAAAPTSSG